ncbi:LysR substrate-binding domain-containing protein [Granulicella mallensis]|uniref:LysR substrate-binding domain-containing protein n=1 Tax=Granulicella mallensis TaxID=940614 RepID=UPI00161A423E
MTRSSYNRLCDAAICRSVFQAQGIAPHISIEANTISAIVEIVRRGRLITILPVRIADEHGELRPIMLKPAIPNRTAALLRRRSAYESAAARIYVKSFNRMVAHYKSAQTGLDCYSAVS